jgi:CRISPR/Cas system-associated endoribonuclease Cas2
VTSSWFFLSTLNYDARSTTHQISYFCFNFSVFIYVVLYDISCAMNRKRRWKNNILALTQMLRCLQYRKFVCNLPVVIRNSFSRRLLESLLNQVQSSRTVSVSLRWCKDRNIDATWIPSTSVTLHESIIKYFIQSQHNINI